jgi:lysophospholipase L1-like esterase
MPAIKPNQTVLFIGDSITDASHATQSAPLGNGYVRIASELFAARYPAHNVTFLNHGIGGNTIRDLHARWTRDVIDHQPDWVSIKTGINDLWCWMVKREGRGVSPEEYAELYDDVISRTKKETKADIVLVDSFFLSRDFGGDNDRGHVLKILPRYLKAVERLAKKHKTLHVRTHAAFQDVLKYRAADTLCPEPVHPNLAGHTVIAYRWLEAIGW